MMQGISLGFTKFWLDKMEPGRSRRSGHQGLSAWQVREGPAGFFQRTQPNRGSWKVSKSERHEQNKMLWSRQGIITSYAFRTVGCGWTESSMEPSYSK